MTDTEQTDQPATGDLGDAGKKALDQERAARKTAEQALKAAQDQFTRQLQEATEKNGILEAANQTMAADIENRQLEITRLNVGLKKGLPQQLIDRLRGTDQAALEADADQFLALIPQTATTTSRAPRADPSQGAHTPSETDPAAQFAALLTGRPI